MIVSRLGGTPIYDWTGFDIGANGDGDDDVINVRRWLTSGAVNEDCEILIVMGKTAPDHPDRHCQQSMILVPKATPGVRIVRDMLTQGYDDAPELIRRVGVMAR